MGSGGLIAPLGHLDLSLEIWKLVRSCIEERGGLGQTIDMGKDLLRRDWTYFLAQLTSILNLAKLRYNIF